MIYCIFGLFLKFTSMGKETIEGKVFALVFVLLVFALVNIFLSSSLVINCTRLLTLSSHLVIVLRISGNSAYSMCLNKRMYSTIKLEFAVNSLNLFFS